MNISQLKEEATLWLKESSKKEMEEKYKNVFIKVLKIHKSSSDVHSNIIELSNALEAFMDNDELNEIRYEKIERLIEIIDIDMIKKMKELSISKNTISTMDIIKKLYFLYPVNMSLDILLKETVINQNIMDKVKELSLGEIIFNKDEIVSSIVKEMPKAYSHYQFFHYFTSSLFANSIPFDSKSSELNKNVKTLVNKAVYRYWEENLDNYIDKNPKKTVSIIKDFLSGDYSDKWNKKIDNFFNEDDLFILNNKYYSLVKKEVGALLRSVVDTIDEYSEDEVMKILEICNLFQEFLDVHAADSKYTFTENKFKYLDIFHKKIVNYCSQVEYLDLFNKFYYMTKMDDIVSPDNCYFLGSYLLNRDILLKYQGRDTTEVYEVIEASCGEIKIRVPSVICNKEFNYIRNLSFKNVTVIESGLSYEIFIRHDMVLDLSIKEVLEDINGAFSQIDELQSNMLDEGNALFDNVFRKWKMMKELVKNDDTQKVRRAKKI